MNLIFFLLKHLVIGLRFLPWTWPGWWPRWWSRPACWPRSWPRWAGGATLKWITGNDFTSFLKYFSEIAPETEMCNEKFSVKTPYDTYWNWRALQKEGIHNVSTKHLLNKKERPIKKWWSLKSLWFWYFYCPPRFPKVKKIETKRLKRIRPKVGN